MTVSSECELCAHGQLVTSTRGGRFLMCRKSKGDPRYAKYPPQPTRGCAGFEAEAGNPGPQGSAERPA